MIKNTDFPSGSRRRVFYTQKINNFLIVLFASNFASKNNMAKLNYWGGK